MEMNQSGGGLTWKRLMSLLEHHHKDILKRESAGTDGFIYLYDAGEYWVAFEQSACLLRQLFPDCDIIVLHLQAWPFPVVMASVRIIVLHLQAWPFPVVMASVQDSLFRKYSRTHIVRAFGPDHKILSGSPVSPEQYSRWHKAALDGLI